MSRNYVRADSQVYNSNETNGNVRKLADCIDTTTNEVKVTFAGAEPGGHGLATAANQTTVINASLRDINNTGAIGDGSSQHSSMCLGYDRSNGQGRSLLVDANGTLETNVNMNTGHGLATEAKQDDIINATNRAINNTGSIGDGSTNATVVALGYDRSNGKGRSLLVDADGHLQCDIVTGGGGDATAANQATMITKLTEIDTAQDLTNTKLDTIETTLTNIETDAAALEVLQTATNTKLDTIDGVLDNSLIQQTAIATDVAALEVLQTSTNTKLDTIETTLTNIETDAAALEVLQTATNSKLDTIDGVLDNSLIQQTAIATDVAALEVLQTSTNTKLDTIETTLTNIETDAAALEVLQTATNSKLDTIDGVLDNSLTKLTEIDTAQDLTNSKLDTIEATLTNIETDAAAQEVLQTTISNQQLLQTSTLALHQTGGTNTTFTIADGGNSVSKVVTLSDIRVAQLTPEVIGYKITSTGTGGSGSDVSAEVSFDGTNFTEILSNISASSKSFFIGNLGDDNFGLGTFGTHFRFKISNNSGGSADYTVTLCGYGVDFAQA
jgi:hypothetical protein